MTLHPCFIGIDIAKDWLDVHDEATGHTTRLANTPAAIAALLADLAGRTPFVAFEATGSYDTILREALAQAGLAFARLDPARARAFARATGRLAKTDALDARTLAVMARTLALEPDPPGEPARQALAALHRRRDPLVDARAAERVRRSEADPRAPAALRGSLERHIAWLDAEIAALDGQIAQAIQADAQLSAQAERLRSAPGVGPVTAVTLLALMPELGRRSAKSIAALAGLAPLNRDSGRRRGQRSIRGGRARVRRALYMAALTAVRRSPRFKDFHDRIRAKGAAPKVALVATARKLLTVLNAIAKNQTAFKPA